MAVIALTYALGVEVEHIKHIIEQFHGVEHRLERVTTFHDVTFYNDSKATNTHAVEAALHCFDKNIILLAGGHDKGISFQELSAYDKRIKLCIAFGETKDQFVNVFSHVETRETMQAALTTAIEKASEGDVILLSPACSSYDQFPNYEVRGKLFKEMVQAYLDEEDI